MLPPAQIHTESSQPAPEPASDPSLIAGGGAPAGVSSPVLRFTRDLATPESVLYDEMADRYLVSNINGSPVAADDNGYILELSPEDKTPPRRFIAAGLAGVRLDAPKGMAISRGVLYVADITVVRRFDVKTGASKGDVPIAGAAFLNDVAAAGDGRIYVSDSGLKMGAKELEPMGADAVYVLDKDRVRALVKSKALASPNGLLLLDQGLLAVSFRANELYRLDDKGARQNVTALPQGGLDGLLAIGDTLLVSSWAGNAVYRGKLGGTFEPVLTGLNAPADIALDSKRQRLLVPRFLDNAVEAYELK